MKVRNIFWATGSLLLVFFFTAALGCGGSSTPKMSIAAEVTLNEGGSFSYFRAFIMKGFDFIDDATVTITVNTGTPQSVPYVTFGIYSTLATTTVNPGDTLTLTVVHDGVTAISTTQMPQRPSVVTPTGSTQWTANTSNSITWDAPGLPAPNSVKALFALDDTVSTEGWDTIIPLPATQIIIPANTLKPNHSPVDLDFAACIVSIDFGGNAAGVSTFEASNYAPAVTFSTLP